jgi:hypothetical protein
MEQFLEAYQNGPYAHLSDLSSCLLYFVSVQREQNSVTSFLLWQSSVHFVFSLATLTKPRNMNRKRHQAPTGHSIATSSGRFWLAHRLPFDEADSSRYATRCSHERSPHAESQVPNQTMKTRTNKQRKNIEENYFTLISFDIYVIQSQLARKLALISLMLCR